MKNYTRKDTRTLEQVAKAVATMRKQVAKKVAAYEKVSSPSFTIISKLIGSSEERTYTTNRFENIAALEEHLLENGTYGKVSYYLYGTKGTARGDMQTLAFI